MNKEFYNREKNASEEREKRDPSGIAAHASGRALSQLKPAEPTSLALEGTVKAYAQKRGSGNSLGRVELDLKSGGSISGTLSLTHLNSALLLDVARRDPNHDGAKKYKIKISFEAA